MPPNVPPVIVPRERYIDAIKKTATGTLIFRTIHEHKEELVLAIFEAYHALPEDFWKKYKEIGKIYDSLTFELLRNNYNPPVIKKQLARFGKICKKDGTILDSIINVFPDDFFKRLWELVRADRVNKLIVTADRNRIEMIKLKTQIKYNNKAYTRSNIQRYIELRRKDKYYRKLIEDHLYNRDPDYPDPEYEAIIGLSVN